MTTGTPSLSLSLAHDTGSSATDGITRDGTFRVGNLQGARSWSWSKDHGASWNEGKSLRLKELRSDMLSATLAGGLIDSAKAATVSGWTVGTDLITAWLLIEDGRHTKGVKIEIGATASGTVQVKAVAAAYATGNHLADWATTSTWKRPVAFSDIDAGYGIKDLRIDGELIAPGYLAATATEVLASRFTLTDGKYAEGQVQVRKTLVDGSSVITGSTSAYQIDSAIGAPVIEKVASDDDVNAAEKAGGITLTGTADAQASVRIEWGDRSKTVVADAHGRWRVTYASFEVPADGRSRVKATATDTSGNTSAEAGREVWIDPHGPEAKPVLLKASDDAGLSRWTVSASTATRIADTLGKSGKDAQVTVSAALSRDLTVEGWFKTDVPVSASAQQLFWLPGATSGTRLDEALVAADRHRRPQRVDADPGRHAGEAEIAVAIGVGPCRHGDHAADAGQFGDRREGGGVDAGIGGGDRQIRDGATHDLDVAGREADRRFAELERDGRGLAGLEAGLVAGDGHGRRGHIAAGRGRAVSGPLAQESARQDREGNARQERVALDPRCGGRHRRCRRGGRRGRRCRGQRRRGRPVRQGSHGREARRTGRRLLRLLAGGVRFLDDGKRQPRNPCVTGRIHGIQGILRGREQVQWPGTIRKRQQGVLFDGAKRLQVTQANGLARPQQQYQIPLLPTGPHHVCQFHSVDLNDLLLAHLCHENP